MEAEKTWENQGKNKTVIKIGGGGGGGGGVGAVVVLGGALATAALAAAFAVRTKGRSSVNDQNSNSIHKQSQQDETLDVYKHKHPSSAAPAEVESNNDDTAVVDDKPMIEEIKGGFVEESKPILCPISPKKLEKDAIVDGSVIMEMEGFEKLPFELMTNGNEVEKRLTKEEIADEIEILEQVYIQEDSAQREVDNDGGEMGGMIGKETIEISDIKPKQEEEEDTEVRYDQEAETEATVEEDNVVVEGVGVDLIESPKNLNTKVETEKQESDGFCSDDDGEISEEKEVIESRNNMDLVAMGLKLSESESSLVSESHSEVGLKALLPVIENPFIESENVNGDERESSLVVVEIIQERDEAVIEGSQEEQVSYIEEQIITENCQQVEWNGEASQGHQLNDPIRVTEDENALVVHLTPAENREFEVPMLKEELIFPVEEAAKDDGASEEVAESLKVNETEDENESEISVQVINGQPKDDEDDDAITEDIKEELILAEDDQVKEGYGANEELNKSVELNEKPKYDDDPEINIEANQVHLLNDPIEVKEDENALVTHPTSHKNREFELPMPKEELIFPQDGEHEEVTESMEPNEKREDDDPEINTGKEVEEDVISSANEQADELNEENVFVNGDQSKDDDEEEEDDDDDDAEIKGAVISPEVTETDEEFTESMELNQNEAEDHEEEEEDDDAEIINVESDDLITETSEDEESSEDDAGIEDFQGLSEQGEEISQGSGSDSSIESDSEVIDPAEEPKREVEGKIEEDRAVKKMSGSIEKTNSKKKRVMEAKKDHYTRRRMLIRTVSLLSSLSCSWYLGLTSLEICFIVFFTMVLSSLATSRQLRAFQHRS